jgi:hypothetical protein
MAKDKVIDKPTIIKRPNKTPDAYNDVGVLQRIIANAERIGDLEYAEMARARIDYLNNGMREELRTEFKRIMQVYEAFLSEKNDRVTHATYTWRKVASKGEKQTMIDWARSKMPAEGFTALVKDGKIKDTAEYLIVSFPNDFPSDVVQLAQNRIDREKRVQSAAALSRRQDGPS